MNATQEWVQYPRPAHQLQLESLLSFVQFPDPKSTVRYAKGVLVRQKTRPKLTTTAAAVAISTQLLAVGREPRFVLPVSASPLESGLAEPIDILVLAIGCTILA